MKTRTLIFCAGLAAGAGCSHAQQPMQPQKEFSKAKQEQCIIRHDGGLYLFDSGEVKGRIDGKTTLDAFCALKEIVYLRNDRVEFQTPGVRKIDADWMETYVGNTIVPLEGNAVAGRITDNGNGVIVLLDDGTLRVFRFTEDDGYRVRSYPLIDARITKATVDVDGSSFVIGLPELSERIKVRVLENGELGIERSAL